MSSRLLIHSWNAFNDYCAVYIRARCALMQLNWARKQRIGMKIVTKLSDAHLMWNSYQSAPVCRCLVGGYKGIWGLQRDIKQVRCGGNVEQTNEHRKGQGNWHNDWLKQRWLQKKQRTIGSQLNKYKIQTLVFPLIFPPFSHCLFPAGILSKFPYILLFFPACVDEYQAKLLY